MDKVPSPVALAVAIKVRAVDALVEGDTVADFNGVRDTAGLALELPDARVALAPALRDALCERRPVTEATPV